MVCVRTVMSDISLSFFQPAGWILDVRLNSDEDMDQILVLSLIPESCGGFPSKL